MSRPNTLDHVLSKTFETKVGCWEWTGSRLTCGYGRTSWNGRLWLTHRLVYTWMVGEIPEGMELDHLCKNKPCCNPEHLEPVTRSENVRRGPAWHHLAATELAKTHCPEGHAYDSSNTYVTPQGHRQCRACKAEARQRYESKPGVRARKAVYGREYRRRQKGATTS